MKKILVLLPFLPYPLATGGSQGAFHMLAAIKDCFEVHVWFHVNNPRKERANIEAFTKALGGKVKVHYTANSIGRNFVTARALKRKFDALWLRHDPQYRRDTLLWGEGRSGYADLQALEDITHIIATEGIDLVQVEFTLLADMVFALPQGVKKVFINHEMRFARQHTMLAQQPQQLAYDHYQYRRQLAEEMMLMEQYDAVFTMSEVDRQKMLSQGVTVPIYASPLCIPPKRGFPEFLPATTRLCYVASGSHFPNVEGLRWLAEKVLPHLEKLHPGYRLEVYGGGWKPEAMGVKGPKNVRFMGFVEDLAALLPGSVMVVPILSGSGMRMKILESVNCSVPYVSTTVGTEGLLFADSRHCFIADEPEMFARRTAQLLADAALQQQFVEAARQVYADNYSPQALGQRRIDLLNRVLGNG